MSKTVLALQTLSILSFQSAPWNGKCDYIYVAVKEKEIVGMYGN